MSNAHRIRKALEYAMNYGGIDGAHHKQWTIDQMVRALTGCPLEIREAKDYKGRTYAYQTQGESQEYKDLITAYMAGEDGPETYTWDEGCPP